MIIMTEMDEGSMSTGKIIINSSMRGNFDGPLILFHYK